MEPQMHTDEHGADGKTAEPREVLLFLFGDSDTVAAYSKEEAIAWYVQDTGCIPEDYEPVEPASWEGLITMDEPGNPKISKHEALQQHMAQGGTLPTLLCSTNW